MLAEAAESVMSSADSRSLSGLRLHHLPIWIGADRIGRQFSDLDLLVSLSISTDYKLFWTYSQGPEGSGTLQWRSQKSLA